MPEPLYIILAIALSAGITWALRAAPFAMLAPLRSSELLSFLGERMPLGIMLILTVYTIREVDPLVLTTAGPTVLALGVTVGLHLWRGSMTLSIFAGTAVHVLLSSAIAAG